MQRNLDTTPVVTSRYTRALHVLELGTEVVILSQEKEVIELLKNYSVQITILHL